MTTVRWGALWALSLVLSACTADSSHGDDIGDARVDGSTSDATAILDGGSGAPDATVDAFVPADAAPQAADVGPHDDGGRDGGVATTDGALVPHDAASGPADAAVEPPDTGVIEPPDTGVEPPDTGVEPLDAAVEPPDAGPPPMDATVEPVDVGPPPVDTAPPPDTGPPVATFTDVYRIIIAQCAFCHASGNIGMTIGRLDLSTGPHAYAGLVGQLSTGNDCNVKGGTRVIPGDAANSLLIHKLEGTQDCGVRMPDGFPAMDPAQVEVFRSWIAAGALPDATSNGIVDYPPQLSAAGLYADFASGTLAPGVRAYEPTYKLWSDGADKRRWLLLPAGTTIDTSDMDFWVYPVGTKAFKEFSVGGVRVETRMLHKVASDHWVMVAYKWRADLSDADASPEGETNVLGTQHDIPDQGTCFACHGNMVDRLLGVSALQLSNGSSPLTLLELQNAGRLSAPPATAPVLPGDGTAQAALGYLHANCGNCHNQRSMVYQQLLNRAPYNGGPVLWEQTNQLSSVETTLGYTTTVRRPNGVLPDLKIIEPGQPDQSELIVRMGQRGGLQMPPTGTEVVDTAGGLATLRAFIQGL